MTLCYCCAKDKQTTRTIAYSTERPGRFNVESADVCNGCRPGHEKDLAMTLGFRRFGGMTMSRPLPEGPAPQNPGVSLASGEDQVI